MQPDFSDATWVAQALREAQHQNDPERISEILRGALEAAGDAARFGVDGEEPVEPLALLDVYLGFETEVALPMNPVAAPPVKSSKT